MLYYTQASIVDYKSSIRTYKNMYSLRKIGTKETNKKPKNWISFSSKLEIRFKIYFFVDFHCALK